MRGRAQAGAAGKLAVREVVIPPGPGEFPANPGVVVSEDRLDAIDHTQAPWLAGYNKLIGSTYGSLSYTPTNPGTSIANNDDFSGETGAVGIDGGACAAQATLWYVLKDVAPATAATHRANAIAILNAYANVLSIGTGGKESARLASGWGCCGFARALSILGPFTGRSTVEAVMLGVFWPFLEHGQGGNWLTTFAEARLGLAVACGDEAKFELACDYYDACLKSCIWITSDGATVQPLPKKGFVTTAPGQYQPYTSSGLYNTHWWGDVPTNGSSAGLEHGQNCEYTRDDGHVQMGLTGAMCGALTATNNGYDALTIHETRLKAALEFQAGKLNTKLDAAITPSGGAAYKMGGWLTGLAVWGSSELPETAELVARSTDISVPSTGNGQMFEGFTFPVGS